ncbi:hypothetical protein I4F81_008146 [Pyropia yezoensis]|uniref:Uncharacterized protein n=1 Tax=Pyropia yezoensis TaxID=2788 RepID=A0ACC3C743_PYRYE|nr:hypothetical protein I4F81_008146 [Neopyropia yezoensis]
MGYRPSTLPLSRRCVCAHLFAQSVPIGAAAAVAAVESPGGDSTPTGALPLAASAALADRLHEWASAVTAHRPSCGLTPPPPPRLSPSLPPPPTPTSSAPSPVAAGATTRPPSASANFVPVLFSLGPASVAFVPVRSSTCRAIRHVGTCDGGTVTAAPQPPHTPGWRRHRSHPAPAWLAYAERHQVCSLFTAEPSGCQERYGGRDV